MMAKLHQINSETDVASIEMPTDLNAALRYAWKNMPQGALILTDGGDAATVTIAQAGTFISLEIGEMEAKAAIIQLANWLQRHEALKRRGFIHVASQSNH